MIVFILKPSDFMNEEILDPHYSALKNDDYCLDDARFARLKQWHGVLFQLASARYYLDELKACKSVKGNLQDAYHKLALFSAFILQYSKCFSSAGNGRVTLDGKRVFSSAGEALVAHKRILNIRNTLVAHNGDSDLVHANVGVKEQDDRFEVKHFMTLAIPFEELDAFELALEGAQGFSVLAINKHLDKVGEELGKIVLLGSG
ncbi:hypothetical protein DXK93_08375 [Achromobacter sp. K91]|nr:hypothetical protein DXK93_08375 [Achromobacter sp. K91]